MGSRTMARPIATRWRWPPESWPRLAVEIGRQVQHVAAPHPRCFCDLGLGHAGHAQPEADVAAHAHVRVERVGLEHHRQPALGGGDARHVGAVDQDPPVGHVLQPGDEAQQGRLAAARRADEDDERAFLHVEVDILDDVHGAEGLVDAFQGDAAHGV